MANDFREILRSCSTGFFIRRPGFADSWVPPRFFTCAEISAYFVSGQRVFPGLIGVFVRPTDGVVGIDPPLPRVFFKATRHLPPSSPPTVPPSILPQFSITPPFVGDISLSCDQSGIYFKPTEVDSQQILIEPTQPTPPCVTPQPTPLSTSLSAPQLDQSGINSTRPVLTRTKVKTLEQKRLQPQLQTQQQDQLPEPNPVEAKSSIFLKPTVISAPLRPPSLQIPSSPKISIPLLSPRLDTPPLPLPVILFLLTNLLTHMHNLQSIPSTPHSPDVKIKTFPSFTFPSSVTQSVVCM
jgi:hypothetical protein